MHTKAEALRAALHAKVSIAAARRQTKLLSWGQIFSKTSQYRISLFHRAFFNSVIDKHQHMHLTFTVY